MASRFSMALMKIIIIISATLGSIIAISGIVSGQILAGLGIGAAFFVLMVFLSRYVILLVSFVFSRKK